MSLTFLAALGILIPVYVVAYLLLKTAIPEQEIAATVSALVLTGGPSVQREIEERLPRRAKPPVSLTGYERPWPSFLVLGGLAIAVASSVPLYLTFRLGPVTAVSNTLSTVLQLLPPAVALGVGLVIGRRSRYALPVAIATALIGFGLAQLASDLVIQAATGIPVPPDVGQPPGGLPPIGVPPGTEVPPDPRPELLGAGIVYFLLDSPLTMLLGASIVGCWIGLRSRLTAYVGMLLDQLPAADRRAIVDLAYESVAQVAPATWPADPAAPAAQPGRDEP